MKLRSLIFAAASILLAAVLPLSSCSLLLSWHPHTPPDRLGREENVFDEIWNMVVDEKNGRRKTVLTTGPEDAEWDYDLGIFQNVTISYDSHNVVLGFTTDDSDNDVSSGYELRIFVFEKAESSENTQRFRTKSFIYNGKSKILYGDAEEAYLIEKFLSDFFRWEGNPTKFSPNDLGTYQFQFCDPIGKR